MEKKPKKKTIILVFRDEQKAVGKYEEFDDLKEAQERTIEAQKTWKGEVIRCFGPSFEAIMATYPEYRRRRAFPLSASAYKKINGTLTHICEVSPDGFPTKVLCSVRLDSVLDDLEVSEPAEEATCGSCLRKLKKMKAP